MSASLQEGMRSSFPCHHDYHVSAVIPKGLPSRWKIFLVPSPCWQDGWLFCQANKSQQKMVVLLKQKKDKRRESKTNQALNQKFNKSPAGMEKIFSLRAGIPVCKVEITLKGNEVHLMRWK